MDYTKQQRQLTYSKSISHKRLTLERLEELGLPKEQLANSTYSIYGRLRLRLVNKTPGLNKVPALYPYSKVVVNQLQGFYNVGPLTNETVSTQGKTMSLRKLDLYLDQEDIDSIVPQPIATSYVVPKA